MNQLSEGQVRDRLQEIKRARKSLEKFLKPSCLTTNPWLSESFGCNVYLKLESMQPIGSFKIRGATYRISQLTQSQKKKGVIAASAGNHAQGVAWAARQMGVSALIVMPVGAPIVKLQNTKALGAEVILKGRTYDEAYQAAKELALKTRRTFVHAFADDDVIAGQGTLGLELLDQLPDVDIIIGSVGGGGMMAGVSTVFKALRPEVKLIGCQARGAPAMVESIMSGKAIKLESVETFADGIAVGKANDKLRKILSSQIDDWVLADEEAIAASVLMLLEKAKIVVEGAGAVPLAALEQLRSEVAGKKVVLIISGGNIDVNVLSRILDVGLIRAGRRLRVNVVLSDRPGSLAGLTRLIARSGVNVLQAIHDRSESSTRINETAIALTLETRGPEHSASVIKILKRNVLRLELTQ